MEEGAGYRVNTQKSIDFLQTKNLQIEFAIKNITSFILVPSKNETLRY